MSLTKSIIIGAGLYLFWASLSIQLG